MSRRLPTRNDTLSRAVAVAVIVASRMYAAAGGDPADLEAALST